MWKFKEEYRDAIISIPALKLEVTRFNLTDELAEKIVRKFPQFAHNICFVDAEPKLRPVEIIEPPDTQDVPLGTSEEIEDQVTAPEPRAKSSRGRKRTKQ
jgi:hypothetical protein